MMWYIFTTLLVQGWHSVLLDTLPSGSFTTPVLLLKNNGWPVMVYAGGGILKIVSWTGNSWDFQYPPFGYEEENTLLDGKDLLWLGDFTGSGWIDIYHQIAGTDWDTLQFFQDSLVGGGLCVDTSNAPHLIFKKGNNLLLNAQYTAGDTWVLDTILFDSIWWFNYVFPACGHDDVLHFIGLSDYLAIHGWNEGGTWQYDTADDVTGQGDFAFSTVKITIDQRGWPHLRYSPYYSGQDYKRKYAFKDASGWHAEFINDDPDDLWWSTSLAIDSLGAVHAAKSDPTGIYHMIRYPDDTLWYNAERIDTFTDAQRIQIAIDGEEYLHVVFTAGDNQKLVYATTNPGVGITESLPEPEPGLVLISAPSGFYITSYSGEARIYDPAGRLVLAREINGKTLMGPLKPGVYFVVAGKQKARIAVR